MTMTPVWLDRPRATHPTLTEPESYDVVVAGAGVVGLLTGLLMARAGRRVAVLEARQVGDGTTGHTTAKVSVLQGTRLSRILRTNGPARLRHYVTANQEGQAWLRQFCDAHEVAYQDRPAFTYATTRTGEVRARAELAVAELAGLDATWEDTTELPYPVIGAIHLADQMQLHPLELMDALVAQLLAQGGDLFEHTRLTGARERDGKVTVTTDLVPSPPTTSSSRPGSRCCGGTASSRACTPNAPTLPPSGPPGSRTACTSRPTVRRQSVRSLPVAGGEELLLVGGNGHITGRAASEAAPGRGPRGLGAQHLRRRGHPHLVRPGPRDRERAALCRTDAARTARISVATGFDKWGLAAAPAAALMLTKSLLADEGAGEGRRGTVRSAAGHRVTPRARDGPRSSPPASATR